jgi:hypothetical protein
MIQFERDPIPKEHIELQIVLDSAIIEKMETAGGVKLTAAHVAIIQAALDAYAFHRNVIATKSTKPLNRVLKLANALDIAIEAMDVIGTCEKVIFWRARLDPEEVQEGLKSLARHCRELHSGLKGSKPGPAPDEMIKPVLESFESVFIEAGGRSAGITRKTYAKRGFRHSRFIDFAFPAFLCLPIEIRPATDQALASRWEEVLKSRRLAAKS